MILTKGYIENAGIISTYGKYVVYLLEYIDNTNEEENIILLLKMTKKK